MRRLRRNGPMNDLGTLDDLPADYVDALRGANLVPLWPALRNLLPPGAPRTATQPTHWPWASIRPLLLRAGELTPIEKAERRVLVLANPGRGLDNLQASSLHLSRACSSCCPARPRPITGTRRMRHASSSRARGRARSSPASVPDASRRPGPDTFRPVARASPRRPRSVHVARRARPAADGRPRRLVRDPGRPAAAAATAVGVCRRRRAAAPHGVRTTARYPLLRYAWDADPRSARCVGSVDAAGQARRGRVCQPRDRRRLPGHDRVCRDAAAAGRVAGLLPKASPARVFHVVEGEGVADVGGTRDRPSCRATRSARRGLRRSARQPLAALAAVPDHRPTSRRCIASWVCSRCGRSNSRTYSSIRSPTRTPSTLRARRYAERIVSLTFSGSAMQAGAASICETMPLSARTCFRQRVSDAAGSPLPPAVAAGSPSTSLRPRRRRRSPGRRSRRGATSWSPRRRARARRSRRFSPPSTIWCARARASRCPTRRRSSTCRR